MHSTTSIGPTRRKARYSAPSGPFSKGGHPVLFRWDETNADANANDRDDPHPGSQAIEVAESAVSSPP